MELLAVAKIVDGADKIIGFRIMELGTFRVKDFSINDILRLIGSIRNLGVENAKLIGTQGALTRYPSILYPSLTPFNNLKAFVVVGKETARVDNDEIYHIYNIADGKVRRVKEQTLIQQAKEVGVTLANARIASRDGTDYIASLAGDFYSITPMSKPTDAHGKVYKDFESIMKVFKSVTDAEFSDFVDKWAVDMVRKAATESSEAVKQYQVGKYTIETTVGVPEKFWRDRQIRDSYTQGRIFKKNLTFFEAIQTPMDLVFISRSKDEVIKYCERAHSKGKLGNTFIMPIGHLVDLDRIIDVREHDTSDSLGVDLIDRNSGGRAGKTYAMSQFKFSQPIEGV